MWAAVPLLALPAAIYNALVVLGVPGRTHGDATAILAHRVVGLTLASRSVWTLTLGDLFVACSLVILFVEFLKASEAHASAIVGHTLSMILLGLAIAEFLIFRSFETSAFFLLTVMIALQTIAGFIVTLAALRRPTER